jgi:hypothetical protein
MQSMAVYTRSFMHMHDLCGCVAVAAGDTTAPCLIKGDDEHPATVKAASLLNMTLHAQSV